jgi:hypothetical protein
MDGPEGALRELASKLRVNETVISPYVADSDEEPALGLLVSGGSRAAGAPAEYALVVEAVREGYLLHYGVPRIVVGTDQDLALLAGDYLYALGIERLAAIGDLDAIRELSDLISLCAQLHARDEAASWTARSLWLASAVAVAVGATPEHEAAKVALREEREGAPGELWRASLDAAARAGLSDALRGTAEAIGFEPTQDPA